VRFQIIIIYQPFPITYSLHTWERRVAHPVDRGSRPHKFRCLSAKQNDIMPFNIYRFRL